LGCISAPAGRADRGERREIVRRMEALRRAVAVDGDFALFHDEALWMGGGAIMPRKMTPEERFDHIERTLDCLAGQQDRFFTDLREMKELTRANSESIEKLGRIAATQDGRYEKLVRITDANTEQIRELKEVALLHERRFERVEKLIAGNTEHSEQLQLALVRVGESLDRHIEESREDRRAIRTLLERFGGLPS
jgi:chromosome segregation ATPase